jgi:hypothetical protein
LRIGLGVVFAALTLAVVPGAAYAGPTPQQSASQVVTKAQAHKVARYVVGELVQALPRPRQYDLGRCQGEGNPKIQRCAVTWSSPDTHCTAQLWVWADQHNFYYEWHRLRCSGPDAH